MTSAEPVPAPGPVYQSLYRRYRPQRFSDVLGQEHVALALRNAVRDGRVAHAYLFSGPRGTGKTSTARILAKALDCEAPEDGEPCGQCASCRSIAAGASFDVHELDAASNNGVDAMRDLAARSSLATPGRWKVYIVDEVHMLSSQASNALLKTLEEPPDHVVFVLATTDPQRVLPTVRSRTQHFEFRLLNESTLDDLLERISSDAGLALPQGAIEAAVRRARGSARDALSVLDQMAASGVIEDSTNVIDEIMIAIGERDTAALLLAVNAAIDAGHDPAQLGVDIIERLRAGFLAQFEANTDMPLTEAERAHVLSLGTVRCVRTMETVGAALVAMRDAPEPRVTLEVALIRCTHPEAEATLEALVERIEQLERRLAESTEGRPARSDPSRAVQRPTEEPSVANPPLASGSKPSTGQRPALGAFRRERTPSDSQPPPAAPGSPEVATPSADEANSGSDATTESDHRRALANKAGHLENEPQSLAPPAAVGAPARELRLEVVTSVWEGNVLSSLRPKARAIYQAARLVALEATTVVMGLPNEAHLRHAEPLRRDVEEALRARLGADITVRLVVGASERSRTSRVRQPQAELPPDEPTEEDFDDLGMPLEDHELVEQSNPAAWAEAELRAAFPGAEEVDR